MIKTMPEISSIEWACYEWVDITGPGESVRTFARGKERTPDEAVRAASDYEEWIVMRRGVIYLENKAKQNA